MPDRSFDFPLGLRPWPNPQRRRRPLLKEGYLLERLENSPDAFRLIAVLGAGKLPGFFQDFARLLPEEAFFVLEFYENDGEVGNEEEATPRVYYSDYLPTGEILDVIRPYLSRLVHDGFVGFGLASNRAGIEMFCSEEKVVTCFTDNPLRLTHLLACHGLPHKEHLPLPADFGHDHLSLLCHHRMQLPAPFAAMTPSQLDYLVFCREIIEQLEMYPVEESLSFFLSRKEQDDIARRLAERPEFSQVIELAEGDFGVLLFDWKDFVNACAAGFDGDLADYHFGLQLRDLLQFVSEGVGAPLQYKLQEVMAESDAIFRSLLQDQRKRIDAPSTIPMRSDRFWCHGVISAQGASLRRDLIRSGWYK
ncbi:MAG: hypothetical protein Q7U44_09535 [Desulfuromonadales bacterium]|nr:hypothetical protein [Desulfuromonadales bacterium]